MLLFDYCRNTFYDNLFNVAVNIGLRPGELFALTIDDIDFEIGFIDVNITIFMKFGEVAKWLKTAYLLDIPHIIRRSLINVVILSSIA